MGPDQKNKLNHFYFFFNKALYLCQDEVNIVFRFSLSGYIIVDTFSQDRLGHVSCKTIINSIEIQRKNITLHNRLKTLLFLNTNFKKQAQLNNVQNESSVLLTSNVVLTSKIKILIWKKLNTDF